MSPGGIIITNTVKRGAMKSTKIAIIGGGNLGNAMAIGLAKANLIPTENITVTRRRVHLIDHLKKEGIQTSKCNSEAVKKADFIFMAVKPKQLPQILEEIAPHINNKEAVIISLVTGICFAEIEKMLGYECTLFRAMPNTAIAIGESMTCISAFKASEQQQKQVLDLFCQMGQAEIIPEELMAASTVLASCGIAFALRFIRAAIQGGVEIGFSSNLAQTIASQTVKGAAELIVRNGNHPEREIDKVTTPQGITISGLNEMEHRGFSSALIKGLSTSYNKIENGKS